VSDDLPPGLPDGFVLERADHLERVDADDGTAYRVVATNSGNTLVHADVVEYDSPITHPMTTGAIGFVGVLGALLAPIVGGYHLAASVGGWATLAGIGGGVFGGWLCSRVALYHSPFGDWLFRFLEWNTHKHALRARGETV